MSFAPLQGIRIVDLSQVLAGPFATYQMALLGAEVLKIEKPSQGDWTRDGMARADGDRPGMGLPYLAHNAGKKSLALDLKDPESLTAARALIATADVFVENFKPGVAEGLGLGFAAVKALRPDIVYCSISAYGQDGPLSDRPAYDHVIQGMCGIMLTTGAPGSGPNKVGAPYIDYATGMNAAMAVMAGLMEARRTGQAQRLDVAMLDSALMLMASLVSSQQTTGQTPGQSGNAAWSGAPASGAFETADGTLMLAANTVEQFHRLAHAVGRPDLASDPRWATAAAMRDNAPALRTALEAIFATKSAEHWETLLGPARVPVAKVRRLDETMAHPHTQARTLTVAQDIPGRETPVHVPALSFKANGLRPGPARPAPELGADTDMAFNVPGRPRNS